MADTIYCGSGKQQTKTWFKATVKTKVLMEHLQEYKGSEFTKININLKDEPDQYGKDVEITVDTWKPNETDSIKDTEVTDDTGKEEPPEVEDNDDLPF